MFRNEFVKFEDRLYIVKRKLKAEYNPDIEHWKIHTGSDAVLKKEDLYYFVELVPELEYTPVVDECVRPQK
jgi:hypothetical protein